MVEKINDFCNDRAFGVDDSDNLYTKSRFWDKMFFFTYDIEVLGLWTAMKILLNNVVVG